MGRVAKRMVINILFKGSMISQLISTYFFIATLVFIGVMIYVICEEDYLKEVMFVSVAWLPIAIVNGFMFVVRKISHRKIKQVTGDQRIFLNFQNRIASSYSKALIKSAFMSKKKLKLIYDDLQAKTESKMDL